MRYSPLRYPGGKNKLSPFIAKICIDNKVDAHYVEPYSGGASVGLFLLMEGLVKKITINDKDRSVYAFWHSVLNNCGELCDLILKTEITVEEWRRQKKVQQNKNKAPLLELGFSTFFLNRTNRSGIINGGVMGGVTQDGNYPLHCRFNKKDLIKRIKRISSRKKDIRLYKKDAVRLIDKIEKEATENNIIFYFDPPYYLKANTLYMNHYLDEHHKAVSDRIKNIKNIKWIISYDNVPEIKKLYAGLPKKEYSFKHTAYNTRVGREILIFSPDLLQPAIKDYNPLDFKLEIQRGQKVIVHEVKQNTIPLETVPC